MKNTKDNNPDLQQNIESNKSNIADTDSTSNETFIRTWLRKLNPKLSKVNLEATEKKVRNWFSIIARVFGGLVLIFLLYSSINGLFDRSYEFKKFNVPEYYQLAGVSGEVLRTKIIHQTDLLPNSLKTDSTYRYYFTEEEIKSKFDTDVNLSENDIEVMNVSFNAIKSAFRSSLGINNPIITGNLIEHKDELSLELIINQKKNGEESRHLKVFAQKGCIDREKECIQHLIQEAAAYILSFEVPQMIAFYYSKNKAYKKALSIMEEMTADLIAELNNAKSKNTKDTIALKIHYAQAVYLHGKILQKQGNYNAAKNKYLKAKSLDSNFAAPTLSLTDVEFEREQEGILKFALENPDSLAKIEKIIVDLNKTISQYEQGIKLFNNKLKQKQTALVNQIVIDTSNLQMARDYLKKMSDLSKNQEHSGDIKKLLEGQDYSEYMKVAEKFTQEERFQEVLSIYLYFLEDLVTNEFDEPWQGLLHDGVLANSPFNKVFRSVQEIYHNSTLDDASIYLYHQIIEHMSYLNWNYDLFELDPEFVDDERLQPTLLIDFEVEQDSAYWYDYSLTPDPFLIGFPLDLQTEQLWYYLYSNYWEGNYLKPENFFTRENSYKETLRQFGENLGEGGMNDAYFNEFLEEYSKWKNYVMSLDKKIK